MEILLFTGVAIALYLAADWVLQAIEIRKGSPLKNRQVIFFVIFLVMATVSFELLQRMLSS